MSTPERSRKAGVAAGLLARVREDMARHDVLAHTHRLLVACSGGGDSVALLDLLHRLQSEAGLTLSVVHVDHGLRPEETRREAGLVARLAGERGLELCRERLQLDARAGEAELRRGRLQALGRVAARSGADAVALGHSLDDRAETVLLNAARGSGPGGLGALRWRRRIGRLLLVRPLLGVRRAELRTYLQARGIDWCEDSSNRSDRFTRNRLRRQVVPTLEAVVPGARDALARLAELSAREEEWLRELARRELDAVRHPDPLPDGLALDAERLRACHPALRARVLRLALEDLRGHVRGLTHDHLEAVLGVLAGTETARDLPGVRVRLQGRRLRLLLLENRRLTGPTGPHEASRKS